MNIVLIGMPEQESTLGVLLAKALVWLCRYGYCNTTKRGYAAI